MILNTGRTNLARPSWRGNVVSLFQRPLPGYCLSGLVTTSSTTVSQTGSIAPQPQLRELCLTEQRDLLKQLYNESGWRKEGDLGVGNEAIAEAHEERTILELIQNARDAIQRASVHDRHTRTSRSGSVAIIVTPESLYIANTGSPFELNNDDVFEAVTGLNRSEKAFERGAIGEKGVGMKSILRSAEQFSIHSAVDGETLSAQFSRSRSTELLLKGYGELLSNGEFRQKLKKEYNSAVINRVASLIDTVVDSSMSTVPQELKGVISERDLERLDTIPPNPVDVIRDLPRLSLFRYPFVASSAADSSRQDYLTDILLRSTTTTQDVWESFGADARAELAEHENRYRTVIKLDYADTRWRSLLETVQESLAAPPIASQHPNAAQQFIDHWDTIEGTTTDSRAKQIWHECDMLDPETLILLGAIKDVNFVKLAYHEPSEPLRLQKTRNLTISGSDRETVSATTDVFRQDINVHIERSSTDRKAERDQQYRVYAQSVDIIAELEQDLGEEELVEPIRLLFEKPRPGDDAWEPDRHPLYLFYPIEDAQTCFPFVIHGPFRVGLDRQKLEDTFLNEQLLDLVPDLVTEAARDLVQSGSGDLDSYQAWMPWLVLPLRATADSPIDRIQQTTYRKLRNTNIVPTNSNHVLTPPDVLFDPERFLAFEPLRTAADRHSRPIVGDPPILASNTIESGRRWFDRALYADADQHETIRSIAEPIGLTTIIDQPFDDESTGTRGLLTVLRDLWGVHRRASGQELANIDWEVNVDDEEHAKQYFTAICEALDRFSETADERDDDRDPAQKLGDWYIPLLPAEKHSSVQTRAEPEIGYLVRASTRRSGGGADPYERSDRIVFRRSETSDRTSIDLLEAPPESLEVYLTPFNEAWTGKLQANFREWGTRELEGPATYYQRIAAEIGGFSDADDATLEYDGEELGYLVNLYYTVSEKVTGRTAAWLRPIPYHNRRFTGGEQHTGVLDLLRRNYLESLPDDYDTFLERRYAQCIPLPSMNGRDRRAEDLVFGPEWADAFRRVADRLDEDEISDPFTDAEDRIGNLRRWAASIETAAHYRPDETPILAAPTDDRWGDILNRLTGPEGEGVPENERDLWVLNFLLHAGVQVGPHIEWGWLLPGAGARDRRTGALTLGETQSFAQGGGDIPEDVPLSPTTTELDRYAEICWRAEHHPAFSAGHTTKCRERFLECSPDQWVEVAGNDIAIPTWWRFTELDSLEAGSREHLRKSILLMWPELDASLLETSWVCTDTGHYIQSPKSTIPALGLVQLRAAPLWPTTWPTSGSLADSEWEDPYLEHCNPATKLVYDPSDGGGGRNIERTLPAIDTAKLTADLEPAADTFEFTTRDLVASLGAEPVGGLSPAGAAEQLNWFLEAHEADDAQAGEGSLCRLETTHDETVRRTALGLLRRLGSRDHIRQQIPDEEADQQRQWQRRDVWHTGTRLLVNDGGNASSVAIGGAVENPSESIAIYTTRLPSFARDILEDRGQPFVEVPSNRPGPLASILGDSDPDVETVTFGVERKAEGEIPELEKATGASVADETQERLEVLADEINRRIPYLIAAYNRVHNTQVDLEEAYSSLEKTVSNQIGIVDNPNRSSQMRRSAQWQPPEVTDKNRPHIALFEDVLTETPAESIPPYYAADGLLQVIDDKPSQQARAAFENVLMKEPRQLERDYRDTIPDIERQISALNTDRLRRVNEAIDQLLAHFEADDTRSMIDWPTIDTRAVLDAIESSSGDPTHLQEDLRPIRTWVQTLSESTPLDQTDAKRCVLAASSSDSGNIQRLMVQVSNRTSSLGLSALAAESRWAELDDWPTSREARTLKRYLTAVAHTREFWAVITDTETAGKEVIQTAIANAERQSAPGAMTSTGDACPHPLALPESIREMPVVMLIEHDEGPIPPMVNGAVQDWCEKQQATERELDPIYQDSEIEALFDAICAAMANPSEALAKINAAFSSFGDEEPRTRTERKQERKRRTEEWYSEDSPFATLDFSTSDYIETASPNRGASPSVGDRSGQSGGYENAEIAAERGRDAELICLQRAWGQFKSASSAQRATILDSLTTWRSYDAWRMQSPDDAITTADAPAVSSLDSFSHAKELLTQPEFDNEELAKSTFQALFDVAEERGPGFDYIDPFGADNEPDTSSERVPNMRRVEVKAVMPDRVKSGRFKLTGNEFRMACRPGPSDTEHAILREPTSWQYLVRIVLLPQHWRTEVESSSDIEIWDIRDVARFGDFHQESEPVWEKLRGGKFYVNFELE